MSKGPYKLLDLFSGIGGFSLGLERSGAFKTVAFCEIEDYPRRVLKKHWPHVPIYEDVRTLTKDRLTSDGIAIDAICGGFPCQDISTAGRRGGLDAERSGLWFEYARIIGELRPRYVIVENVAALLTRGIDRVLGSLAEIGYDAEWEPIRASDIGAPHRRERIWIVAYPNGLRELQSQGRIFDQWRRSSDGCENVADASCINAQGKLTSSFNPQVWGRSIQRQIGSCRYGNGWWAVEPNVGRVAHGIPDRSHRLKGLGNAVVPQIPEMIGRAILEMEQAA